MDDLRWILFLVGAVVVVAIYFSSRFESEDWTRERKEFEKNKSTRKRKKSPRKKMPSQPATAAIQVANKIEPSMGAEELVEKPEVEIPEAETPRREVEAPVDEMGQQSASATEVVVATDETHVDDVTAEIEEPSIDERKNVEAVIEPTEDLVADAPIDPGIEDEITEVDIPMELAVAEAEIQIADIASVEEPAQAEMPLDIEPLVLSISVLADTDAVFSGLEIKEALEAEGTRHGAMQIFHFHDPAKQDASENEDAVFSVANVLEPGLFDLNKLNELETPGLMMFCQLPGPLPGEEALELMLDKGRGLAVRLHGHMCDEKRNPFTTQAKTYYLDKIATFVRELELAKKKG